MGHFLIESRPALIGINTVRPVQRIEQPRGKQEIRQVKPELIIDSAMTAVQIDQSACFAEAGLKGSQELSREYAEMGRQAALEAIGRIVEEGNTMARTPWSVSLRTILANLVQERHPLFVDFNVKFIPQSRPDIEWTPGYLNIDWSLGGAEIGYTPSKPLHQYTPGKAEVYIRQRNELKIEYIVDEKV